MNNNKEKTCAFTGHRPERLGFDESKVKAWLEEKIQEAKCCIIIVEGRRQI